jgi:hypothetical protein
MSQPAIRPASDWRKHRTLQGALFMGGALRIPALAVQVAVELLIVSDAGVAGFRDGGRPVRRLQLGQDGRDMVADCLLREDQAACDLMVSAAGGDEVEHLTFPSGQFRKDLGRVSLLCTGEESTIRLAAAAP